VIVPETGGVEGHERPRDRLVAGWWHGLPGLEKERVHAFLADGRTEHLAGPMRRSVEATWRQINAEGGERRMGG
jgi:hypothetical protein